MYFKVIRAVTGTYQFDDSLDEKLMKLHVVNGFQGPPAADALLEIQRLRFDAENRSNKIVLN